MGTVNERGGHRVALWIAIAAMLVSTPRMVVIFLGVDGTRLAPGIEGLILGISGAATAITLTVGCAYLARTLALPTRRGGWLKVLLFIDWLLILCFSALLIAPFLLLGVSGRAGQPLSSAISNTNVLWIWAIVATVAPEFLAGGAMVADVITAEPAPKTVKQKPSFAAALMEAATKRIVQNLEPAVPATAIAVPAKEQVVVATMPFVPLAVPAKAPAIALSATVEPATEHDSVVEPMHKCPNASKGCTFERSTVQALNAHVRFCKFSA